MIEVPGPDTQTSCGEQGRSLKIGNEYVVGIGGACSLIRAWEELSGYTDQEMLQIREEMNCGAASLLPTLSSFIFTYITAIIVYTY